jgi:acyl-coenzyme A thioesterase PaaI-like protein
MPALKLPALRLDGGKRNMIRSAWDRLARLPGGKRAFSRMAGMAAPYTGSIGAQVVALGRGHSETRLTDRRAVRNHLACIHAVALANLAELTGNMAVAYSLPDDARFIVAGMSIDYVKKARGTITGTCDVELPTGSERREIEVPVSLRDAKGDEVARATLRTLIGPKREQRG